VSLWMKTGRGGQVTEVGVGDAIGSADRGKLKGANGWTVSWKRNGLFLIKEHDWFLN
jgi:hypothetical protein